MPVVVVLYLGKGLIAIIDNRALIELLFRIFDHIYHAGSGPLDITSNVMDPRQSIFRVSQSLYPSIAPTRTFEPRISVHADMHDELGLLNLDLYVTALS